MFELCGKASPEFLAGMKEALNYPSTLVERFKNAEED